jgi:hypothetical protein
LVPSIASICLIDHTMPRPPQNGRPLRIHATKNVTNNAVLPGGIERLQYDQKRLVPVRIEQVLQLVHAFDVFLYLRQSLLVALVLAGVGRIDFR